MTNNEEGFRLVNAKQKRISLIGLSFIIFAVISALLIVINNKMYITNDSLFHSSRLLELIQSRSLFPRYAFNSFNFDGSAVITMYPYLFLYPVVLIFKLAGSIKAAFLLNFIFATWLSLILSYLSSLTCSHDRLISYVFAVIYALSGEAMGMYIYAPFSDLGVYFSYLFLPLVIFGFLAFLKHGRWVMLSIGMTLIMYSNIISVAFIAGLLSLWLLCNYRRLADADRWIALLKSVALTAVTTAAVWIPILKLMINNDLRVPSTGAIVPVSLGAMTRSALHNSFMISCQNLTVFSLLGIAAGLIFFRRLSFYTKQLYIFAIFIILLSSKWFPWQIFSRNYFIFRWVRSLQMTVRLLVIPQLILEFILAVAIVKYGRRRSFWIKGILVIGMILLLSLAQVKVQSWIVDQSDGVNDFSQIKRTVIRSHSLDYWPMASVNNRQRPLIYQSKAVNDDNGKSFGTYRLGHGCYHFNNHTYIKRLSLPVFYYYGTPYRVRLDGREVRPYAAHRQLMTIEHVNPGHHQVHITVPLTKSTVIARGLTLVGLLIYGWLILKRRKKIFTKF